VAARLHLNDCSQHRTDTYKGNPVDVAGRVDDQVGRGDTDAGPERSERGNRAAALGQLEYIAVCTIEVASRVDCQAGGADTGQQRDNLIAALGQLEHKRFAEAANRTVQVPGGIDYQVAQRRVRQVERIQGGEGAAPLGQLEDRAVAIRPAGRGRSIEVPGSIRDQADVRLHAAGFAEIRWTFGRPALRHWSKII
jgi:hypothetical protein